MNTAEVIEGTALVVRESAAPATVVGWTPSFAVAVDDAIERKREKNRFFREVMDQDLHYGVIPGTGTKPTLLKPGAEMLLANMGLNPELSDAEPPILDVTGRDHNGEPYIHYRRVCRIYRQVGLREDERMLVARAEGSCSSWEAKYRYRNDQRKCPSCGKPAIIAGKKEYGGGYVCFKKKDGCGAKFADNDPAIVGQTVGKVPNPDIAEIENTILKMADKRALVAATLLATGCSDIFTQDVEDMVPSADEPPPYEPPVAPPAPTPTDIILERAAVLGLIPAQGSFDERMAAMKAHAAENGVRATVQALSQYLGGLEAAKAPKRAPAAAEAPKTATDAAPLVTANRILLHAYAKCIGERQYRELLQRHWGVSTSKGLSDPQVVSMLAVLGELLPDERRAEIDAEHASAVSAWAERQS